MDRGNKQNIYIKYNKLIIIIFFLVSILIRFCLADFPKIISTYPDELRYFQIARSLANGYGLAFHNISSDFQKILYSVIIAPAFMFNVSVEAQIKIINLINCIVMSSSIFPVYFLAQRLLKGKKIFILLASAIVLLMPDMIYSMSFMSEVIFFPLSLWIIYVFYRSFLTGSYKKRFLYNIILGILIYLVYLCKEIGLYFILAYTMITLLECIKEKTSVKNRLISLGVCWISFIAIYLLFKLTFFYGMGSSYDQMGIDAILKPYNFLYMIYGFMYNLLFILVAFLLFPVILPAFNLRKISKEEGKLYLFTVFSLIIGAAAIAYTITVREDLGLESPRQHLRYIMPLFIPLFILFLKQIDEIPKERVSLPIITAISGIAMFTVLKKIGSGPAVDQTALQYYDKIPVWLKRFIGIDENIGTILVKLGIVLFFILIAVLIYKAKAKKAYAFFLIVFCGICLINNYVSWGRFRMEREVSEYQVSELNIINEFCHENQNSAILALTSFPFSAEEGLIDTYIDAEIFYSSPDLMGEALQNEDMIYDLRQYPLRVYFPWKDYVNQMKIDYIISVNGISLENVEEISLPGVSDFKIYQNLDPEIIDFN